MLEKKLLQEEIIRINAEVAKAKERRAEEERLADTRAMEYLQKKLVREFLTDTSSSVPSVCQFLLLTFSRSGRRSTRPSKNGSRRRRRWKLPG